ncbi:Ubiquitin fusion degradation protein 1 [Ceratocystis lukuohia]|uniref:Ubiquitin fusion degradation protein 1 n=3 Tax=Ceratocystis TaxID=5157 RepID=A0A0F8DN52_CERFI|nr:Ubiquitin fusion degradation protein 1 [Ceratocystis platani]PHH53961.1 Ubiquitin fusion degradation protein 1 [Ceratocystis fimbriata CBS 114723]
MYGAPYASRPAARRFDEYYRCYPMAMAPGPERPSLNYGSKIFLPPSALDKVSRLHVQWPLQMELVNGQHGTHTHAGVLEFVAEEGRAYIPQWMMTTLCLDVGDMVQIKTTSLSLARLVKLEPQSVNFLDISDPRAVLEKAFRNFATLTEGDVFNFEYNDEEYYMKVLEVKPQTEKMGVSMIETDVEVDFAPPVGYVEPEYKSTTASNGASSAGTARGGIVHEHGTMAKDIGYAAIAPSALAQIGSTFQGEGHRLVVKKNAASGNGSGTAVPTPTAVPGTTGPMNGAKPLRLAPNKLFFGYEIKPVRTKEDKERDINKPKFEGQGQSLRPKKK